MRHITLRQQSPTAGLRAARSPTIDVIRRHDHAVHRSYLPGAGQLRLGGPINFSPFGHAGESRPLSSAAVSACASLARTYKMVASLSRSHSPSCGPTSAARRTSTNLPQMAQLLLLFGSALSFVAVVTGICPSPKFTVVPNHSACLSASQYANASLSGVSSAERTTIVNYHNNLRKVPLAADMQAMVWDAELAMVAQSWASNCQYAHDGGPRRGIPGKYAVGQNIAYNYPSRNWLIPLGLWGNESVYFQYNVTPTQVVGHYTQMVWAKSSRIGCGAAFCSTLGGTTARNAYFYVCNYALVGNIAPNQYRPYTRAVSRRGELCTSKFSNGLCNCGGKTCYNGGTLNLNTCACTCLQPFDFLPNCDLNCTKAVQDPSFCSGTASSCTAYYNWPYYCPNTCSWCPLAGAA